MHAARELLARTRERVMRSVDVGTNSARAAPTRDSRDTETDERSGSEAELEEERNLDSNTHSGDAGKKRKWKWTNPLRKAANDKPVRTEEGSPDPRRRSVSDGSEDRQRSLGDGAEGEEAREDLGRQLEAYTQEYDNAAESQYRVQQRPQWQAKVTDVNYWKKVMSQPIRVAEKKPATESWDAGLQTLGDVPVSSKYGRHVHSSPTRTAEPHSQRRENTYRYSSEEDAIESHDDRDGDYGDTEKGAADDGGSVAGDDEGYSVSSNDVEEYHAAIHPEDDEADEFTHTTNGGSDGHSTSRQQRNLRYFAEEDDEMHAAGNFGRASRRSSQYSNSSAMSIGAIGLPANVQPFRWVPYYGGVNGFGYNPFSPARQAGYPPPPEDGTLMSPTPGAGAYEYDMGVGTSYPAQVSPAPQISPWRDSVDPDGGYRPGSAPWMEDHAISVSPANGYSTSYHSPSPGVGHGNRPPTETPRLSGGDGGRVSAAMSPSIFDPYGSGGADSAMAAEADTRRIVAEGQRRYDAQMASGAVDVLGIGAGAPATPALTPVVGTFYGPIGVLGIEASEKREKLEASTGTEGHTVRAYRLAAAYPDLANLCGDGVLMMTRMWCDPTMLTSARQVRTPDLPELKEEDGVPKRAYEETANMPVSTSPVSAYGMSPAAETTRTTGKGGSPLAVKATPARAAQKSKTSARPQSGASRTPSRGVIGAKGDSSSNNNNNNRAEPTGLVSRPGSFNSVAGGSMYQLESSMMGTSIVNVDMDEYADMDVSFAAGAAEDGADEDSSNSSSSSDTSDSATSSSASSDDDEYHEQASVIIGARRASVSVRKGRRGSEPSAVDKAETLMQSAPSASGHTSKAWSSRASLSGASSTAAPKATAAAAAATAAKSEGRSSAAGSSKADTPKARSTAPAAAATSRRTSITAAPAGKARAASVSMNRPDYEYGLDLSFHDYVNAPKASPPPQAGATAKPAGAKASSKSSVSSTTAPNSASTVDVKPAGTVAAKPAATTDPKPVAVVGAKPPSTTDPKTAATASKPSSAKPAVPTAEKTPQATSARVPPRATVQPPPVPASTAPQGVANTKPAAELTPATSHAKAESAAARPASSSARPSTGSAAESDVEELTMKRRNSKFLSNDLKSSGSGTHDRAIKLAPLPSTSTAVSKHNATDSAKATPASRCTTSSTSSMDAKSQTMPRSTSAALRPAVPSASVATPNSAMSPAPTLGSTRPEEPKKAATTAPAAPIAAPVRRVTKPGRAAARASLPALPSAATTHIGK